ncbi:MAG: hypothetical protein OQK82_07990 [Candidatus Pacearchaeota archaeon]|nr:hypothetical protein [Candidatus Pacearchaeota archaeon]
MKKPIILDKRAVRLEKITHPDYIPFLGGRPNRVTVVGHDDQINLRILLNTTTSIEEFIHDM